MLAHLALLALCQTVAPSIPPVPPSSVMPDSGSLVRIAFVRPGSDRRVVGILIGTDSASLLLRLQPATPPLPNSSYDKVATGSTGPDSVIAIPRASITRMEIGGVRVSNSRRDAVVGGVMGGVAGAVYGIAVQCGVSHFIGCYHDEVSIVGTTLVGGLSGAALGAIIGSFSHHEGWRPVMPIMPAVVIAPGGPAGVAVSLRLPIIR